MTAPEKEIPRIPTVATVVNGRIVGGSAARRPEPAP
jgi:hypothetical protein